MLDMEPLCVSMTTEAIHAAFLLDIGQFSSSNGHTVCYLLYLTLN